MRVEIERWLTGRKSLLTIPVVLVLIAEVWGWLLQPPQPDINAGGTPRIQAQWRKLLPLRAALQNVGIDEQQTQAFSPIDLPVTGAALMASGTGAFFLAGPLRDARHGFLNAAGKSGSTADPATGGGRCAVKAGVYCCFLCRCWLRNAIPFSLRSIVAGLRSLINGATVGR